MVTFALAQDATVDQSTPATKSAPENKAQEAKPVNISGIDFKFNTEKSNLSISLDQPTEFEKTVSDADKQVIIEIKNAKIAKKYTRKLDTSSFKTNVSIISPYQSDKNVRVVLQMKAAGNVDVTQDGKKIIATIENSATASNAEAPSTPLEPTNINPDVAATAPITEVKTEGESVERFFQSKEEKKYVGKHISLQLRDADIHDVFRVIGEASEFNIVLGDEVRGRVTLNLVDVPWDQALDTLLSSQKLAAERNGNIMRVTTVDSLTKEKEAEASAKRASEAAEPLVVKIFPLSYAVPDDMKKILEDFLSKESSASPQPGPGFGGSVSLAGQRRGSVQIDTRTNALVVRDTATTIEKVKRIVKELDTQTPQVLIEAKFVEVKEGSTKNMQGRVFATSREFDATSNQLTFKNKNNFGTIFGGSQNTGALPTSFAITPVAGASFGFSPRAGLIPGMSEIAALVSILESQNEAKIIASPRVVTQNKQQAEISQGTTIQLPSTAGANSAGTFTQVNAVLKLTVTPQVTNEGSISMKITFSQDSLSAQQLSATSLSTDTKKVDTNVLVDSGATLVIGGIYSSTVNTSEAGIPFLRDLPILGILFGSKESQLNKGELFIFLTPRVINEKESGLKS